MFIRHVLGVDTDHCGLYGDTSAYHGTVEQQGQLSLHFHMLLWIWGGVSPDEICCRIIDPDSDFWESLIQYFESVHAGEFMTGTKDEVEACVKAESDHASYHDPTKTMPESLPPPCGSKCGSCNECGVLTSWWSCFMSTVDDLLLRSNVHKCSSNKNKDGSQNKACPLKGCLDNIWGKCKARFPCPTFGKTEVDEESRGINMKKHEPWLNTFTYAVTYLLWCNTDITSLCSGKAIKGVLLYVSNYVTQLPLKTHVIFDTVCSIFQKNSEMVDGPDARKEKAHKLMTKIVNSVSAKMEMGSLMICMYFLGNPDHYKSHKFPSFYWQSFVQECQRPWVHTDAGKDTHDIPDKVAIMGKLLVSHQFLTTYIAPMKSTVCVFMNGFQDASTKRNLLIRGSQNTAKCQIWIKIMMQTVNITWIAKMTLNPLSTPCFHFRMGIQWPVLMAPNVVLQWNLGFQTSWALYYHALARVIMSTTAVQC